jgi:hypothetical protein
MPVYGCDAGNFSAKLQLISCQHCAGTYISLCPICAINEHGRDTSGTVTSPPDKCQTRDDPISCDLALGTNPRSLWTTLCVAKPILFSSPRVVSCIGSLAESLSCARDDYRSSAFASEAACPRFPWTHSNSMWISIARTAGPRRSPSNPRMHRWHQLSPNRPRTKPNPENLADGSIPTVALQSQ